MRMKQTRKTAFWLTESLYQLDKREYARMYLKQIGKQGNPSEGL